MPFQPRTEVSPGSTTADVAAARKLLNLAGRGVDAAFRSLTLDTLMVRGRSLIGSLSATTFTATTATITTLTSTTITGAARGTFPGGYASVAVFQGPTAPPFDITGAAVTVTVGANRRIRVEGWAQISSSVGTDVIKLQVAEGGSILMEKQYPQNQSNYISYVTKPGAGDHTYRLRVDRAAGTGNLTNNANNTFLTYILVEDIGT